MKQRLLVRTSVLQQTCLRLVILPFFSTRPESAPPWSTNNASIKSTDHDRPRGSSNSASVTCSTTSSARLAHALLAPWLRTVVPISPTQAMDVLREEACAGKGAGPGLARVGKELHRIWEEEGREQKVIGVQTACYAGCCSLSVEYVRLQYIILGEIMCAYSKHFHLEYMQIHSYFHFEYV